MKVQRKQIQNAISGKRLHLLWTCGVLLLTHAAHADSAPPQTDSDLNTQTLDISISRDEIRKGHFLAEAEAGGFLQKGSESAEGLALDFKFKKRAAFDMETVYSGSRRKETIHWGGIGLGASTDLKLKQKENEGDSRVQSYEIKSPSIHLIDYGVDRFAGLKSPEYFDEVLPYRTFGVDIIKAQYSSEEDVTLKSHLSGLEIIPASASMHTAFKINEVPVELCAHADVFKFIAGRKDSQEIQDQSADTSFTALDIMGCAAVQAGPIRLSNETSYREKHVIGKIPGHSANHSKAFVTEFDTQTHLDFVTQRGHKIGVSYEYEHAKSGNRTGDQNAEVKAHIVSARAAF